MPQSTINAPDTGLFYLWVYCSTSGIKDVYGYILVDNLQAEIALGSISLPNTKEVELGKSLKLTPTFSPNNTTNKIVTWSSSDESVATVDNAGNITPKKLGATIITVTSQDGNKKATCTVTVVASGANNSENQSNGGSSNNGTSNGGSSSGTSYTGSGASNGTDTTRATGKLPQTGVGIGVIVAIVATLGVGIFSYYKIKEYRGI